MLKYDRDKIAGLISQINSALDRLRKLKQLDKSEFLNNIDKVASAKYHLIVAIEAVTDICNHIISKNGFKLPESYAGTFDVIKEKGLIGDSLSVSLKNMVRFRNRLVHIYWDINDDMVYQILQTNLTDFHDFLKALTNKIITE